MWGNIVPVFNQYRAAFIAGLLAVLLMGAFIAGWKVESWRWAAAEEKRMEQAIVLQLETQKKTLALQAVADNTQQGAVNAVKSVYEYYSSHPTIKYLGNDCLQQYNTNKTLPSITEATNSNNTASANNGHATVGATETIQVIQPNLLERCAETTVQALQCRQYVLDLTKETNNGN